MIPVTIEANGLTLSLNGIFSVACSLLRTIADTFSKVINNEELIALDLESCGVTETNLSYIIELVIARSDNSRNNGSKNLSKNDIELLKEGAILVNHRILNILKTIVIHNIALGAELHERFIELLVSFRILMSIALTLKESLSQSITRFNNAVKSFIVELIVAKNVFHNNIILLNLIFLSIYSKPSHLSARIRRTERCSKLSYQR